jgi:hypothetical protein
MKRPTLVAVLVACLLVSGCATHQPLLPPGQDPDELVATIARRGQGPDPRELPTPQNDPEPSRLRDYLQTAGMVIGVCVALPFIVIFAALSAADHGLADSAGLPWSKDYVQFR